MPRSRLSWGSPCTWGDMQRVTFSNGTKVTVNKGIAELVKILGDETIKRGYAIRSGVTGGYNCRAISGTSSYSNHAWGLALDINWDKNPWRNPLVTDMPSWMVDLWVGYGFRWGGTYRNTKDAMHYEFMGTRADAKTQTVRARANLLGPPPPPDPPDPAGEFRIMASDHKRLVDTRTGDGKPMTPGQIVLADTRKAGDRPSWARGAAVNVTLLDVRGTKDTGMHASSKWSDGPSSIANNDRGGPFANPNLAMLKFAPDGHSVSIALGGNAQSCHVIVDFQAWIG